MLSLLCRAIDTVIVSLLGPPLRVIGLVQGDVPVGLRVSTWGLLLGIGTMLVYGLFSDQETLESLKDEVSDAREALRSYDGTDVDEMGRRMKRAFGLSLQQLRLMLGPTLLAGVPVVVALIWMEGAYTHRSPEPGEAIKATVHARQDDPGELVRWRPDSQVQSASGATSTIVWPGGEAELRLETVDSGATLLTLPLSAPVRRIERTNWTHWWFDDGGYALPADAPIRHVSFELPRREVIPFGPTWLRGWYALFLVMISIAAGGTKVALGID